MFVIGNFFSALAYLLDGIFTVLLILIFVRAIISWVNPDPFNPVVQFLHRTTDPILEPICRLLPPGAVVISPIIAGIAIMFLRQFLVKTLMDISIRLAS